MTSEDVIRILLLEDSPYDAELLERVLRKDGLSFTLNRVDTESDFITALDEFSPDIILTDYRLPSFDGSAALKIAQEKSPEIPVIFVTGELAEDMAITILRDGARDFIRKNRLSQVTAAVRRALEDAEDRRRRKVAEEGLRIEHERLISILDNMEDCIYIVNSDHLIEYVNPATEKVFGKVSGRHCHEYFHGLSDICPWCKHPEVTAGKTVRWEWRFAKTEKTYDIFETPFRNPDGSLSKLAILHDITSHKKIEMDLRESEGRYRHLVEIAPDAIFVAEAETGIITDVNRKGEELLGRSRDEIIGMHQARLHPAGEAERYRSIFMNHSTLPSSATRDLLIVNNKGDKVPVDIASGTLEFNAKRFTVGIFRDITDRKRSEDALRDSESRLARASMISHVGHWDWEPATGRLIWTDEVYKIFGYQPGEIVPSYELFVEWIHPEDRPGLMEKVGASILEPIPYNAEFRFRRRDGEERYGQAIGTADFDPNGKPIRLSGVMMDITDRKRMEEALRTSVEQMKSMIDAVSGSGIGLFVVDKDYKVRYMNQPMTESFGQQVGGNCYRDVGGSDSPCPYCKMKEVVEEGRVVRYQPTVGDGRTFDIVAVPFVDSDGAVCKLEIIRDITEEKKMKDLLMDSNTRLEARVAEEMEKLRRQEQILVQQSKLAAMGEMLGAIAHQWRQPLNSIGLIIQSLNDAGEHGELTQDYLNERVQKGFEIIKRMSKTIDDFRNFFRPDKEKVLFDVKEAVQHVLSMLSAQLTVKNISYTVTCHTHDRTFHDEENMVICGAHEIMGYRNEFEHVILNLISNAAEAISQRREEGKMGMDEPGMISIDVTAEGGRVVIDVADNGGGVPDEIKDRMFEPYFTTKVKGMGTGIGLYMSKVIIEEHMKGRLTCENSGHGARFRVEI